MSCTCPEPYGRNGLPHLSRCPESETSRRYAKLSDAVVAVCRFTPTDVTPGTGDFIAVLFASRQDAERWAADERWNIWHSDLMILDLQT